MDTTRFQTDQTRDWLPGAYRRGNATAPPSFGGLFEKPNDVADWHFSDIGAQFVDVRSQGWSRHPADPAATFDFESRRQCVREGTGFTLYGGQLTD
jgi:hypothetical protein